MDKNSFLAQKMQNFAHFVDKKCKDESSKQKLRQLSQLNPGVLIEFARTRLVKCGAMYERFAATMGYSGGYL